VILLLPDGVERSVGACPFCGLLWWDLGTEQSACDVCGTDLVADIWRVFDGPADACDFLQCDAPAAVCFVGFDGRLREWCRECFDAPCGRCGTAFERDANRAKGLCQACRAEINSWSESDECDRCGCETDETTLEGKVLCRDCQDARREQHDTRDTTQHGLGEWSQ